MLIGVTAFAQTTVTNTVVNIVNITNIVNIVNITNITKATTISNPTQSQDMDRLRFDKMLEWRQRAMFRKQYQSILW